MRILKSARIRQIYQTRCAEYGEGVGAIVKNKKSKGSGDNDMTAPNKYNESSSMWTSLLSIDKPGRSACEHSKAVLKKSNEVDCDM